MYHNVNEAAHPTQIGPNQFETPRYGQMYFLDTDEAVRERLNHPLNHDISHSLMALLDETIRVENRYVHSFMIMKDVEDEVAQRAGNNVNQQPQREQLIFTQPESVDKYRQFDIPRANEVCVVLTLNDDQTIPEFELGVRQRGKSLQTMRNTDKHAVPFTYPLFFPRGCGIS